MDYKTWMCTSDWQLFGGQLELDGVDRPTNGLYQVQSSQQLDEDDLSSISSSATTYSCSEPGFHFKNFDVATSCENLPDFLVHVDVSLENFDVINYPSAIVTHPVSTSVQTLDAFKDEQDDCAIEVIDTSEIQTDDNYDDDHLCELSQNVDLNFKSDCVGNVAYRKLVEDGTLDVDCIMVSEMKVDEEVEVHDNVLADISKISGEMLEKLFSCTSSVSAKWSLEKQSSVDSLSSLSSTLFRRVFGHEKRLRKKEQNKTAASRYRQKKRKEQGQVLTEFTLLEQRNVELKTKLNEMTHEIDYLKRLINELCP